MNMTTTLEEFLAEHNRLSPVNLQATKEILLRFQDEKSSLFRDGDWSVEKIRRPFVVWLCAVSLDKKRPHRAQESGWVTMPRPLDDSKAGQY
jgi:hypothetical protein